MRRMSSSWALITVVATLVFALPAAAQSNDYTYVRIVRLSLVEGDVQLMRAGEAQWESALMNMPIRNAYTLATGRGRAEVEFESGATARIASNSTLHFTELALAGGGRITRLTLRQGTATFYANLSRNDLFEVHTPHLVTAITDDARYRVDVTSEGSWVSVWKGDVQIASISGVSYRLGKGRGVYVSAFDTSQVQLIRNAEPDSWDRWVSERDDVILSATHAAQRYTNSPYTYGLSDLYQYGNWYNVSGYGYGWQPYGVPFGWSPFWNGRWISIHGSGWTWVSHEPWGWLPYHYGSWTCVPGQGWFWVPGQFNQWNPAPVHWIQIGGHVGWVPRSPNDVPGNPPVNLPYGPVVNTPRGVIGGTPNQHADLNPDDKPVFVLRAPLDDGVPIRPRGFSGATGPTPRTPDETGTAGPGTVRAPGGVGRPVTITPEEPGIVYDKDQHKFINNPRAPVRPQSPDEPVYVLRPPAMGSSAPPGPAARPATVNAPGTAPAPPRSDAGARPPDRPRYFEDRSYDKPDRAGSGQIGAPRRPDAAGPPPQSGAPRGDAGRPSSPQQPQSGWGSRPTSPSAPPPAPRTEAPRPMPSPPPAPARTESPRPPSNNPPPARPPVKPPGN